MEKFFDQYPVLLDLFREFLRGIHGGQGVVVGHDQEVHASGFRQFLEGGDEVRPVVQGLFQNDAAERQAEAEFSLRHFDQLLHQPVGREVAAFRNSAQDACVQVVVFIKGVFAYLEEIVMNQAVGLVRYEGEGYVAHGRRRAG